MIHECQDLRTKILDQSIQEVMLKIEQSEEDIKELKQKIELYKDQIPLNLKGILYLEGRIRIVVMGVIQEGN